MAGLAMVRSDRDFRHLWIGNAVSQVGTQVSLLAIPIVAALSLQASTWEVAVLRATGNLAFLLIGLPAGVWCDRVRRRPVLILGDLGRAVALGSIPLAWAMHALTLPQLYAVAFCVSMLTVFFDVSYQSYLPGLVGRKRIVDGNGALEATRTVAYTVGPTFAGFAIQWLSAPVAVIIDAISFLWSGSWIASIRAHEAKPVQPERRHMAREIVEGLRFVFGHSALRAIAIYGSTTVLFGAAQGAVLILFLLRTLRLSPGGVGLLYTCSSVGAVIGAFTATPIARRIGQSRGIMFASALGGFAGLLVPIATRGPALGCFVVGSAASSFGIVVFNIIQVSFRQMLCPEHLLGRMNATMRFVLWGTSPVGALLGGALGTWLGLRTTMWVTAVGGLIPFLVLILSPLRRARDLVSAEDTAADASAMV
jgi:MFS family permease